MPNFIIIIIQKFCLKLASKTGKSFNCPEICFEGTLEQLKKYLKNKFLFYIYFLMCMKPLIRFSKKVGDNIGKMIKTF